MKNEKHKNNKEIYKDLNNKNISLLSNVTNNSHCSRDLDNTFIIFKSINEILYLIYSTETKSIISYNLNEFKINAEIKNAHDNNYITNFRHFFDKNNKRDLIMSISAISCNIKIWNNENLDCILNIKKIYLNGIINSACFLFHDNKINIIASNNFFSQPNSIKVYNFEGTLINEIKNSKENTYYIDSYFDRTNSKLYIISCNYDYVKSYDYINNEIYYKYYDCKSNYRCSSRIIETKEIVKLIESASDGIIRIWNFHSGNLIKKIYVSNLCLYGICIWDNDNIFIGSADNNIKLININKNKIYNISGCNNWICTISKINHKKYGNCIISQGIKDEQIKIWIIKNN